ncbi:MAG TPA: asparagine synthase (glutamine-hydrolyzing) [Pirellulales bacterium]
MCGIAGVFNPRDFDAAAAGFPASVEQLAHRGPDQTGVFASAADRLLLGHTRLSIIDLTSGNDQPLVTSRSVTVFNGEIYNFRELKAELVAAGVAFATAGDTEVIARGFEHWGDALFARLVGMYAIGIFDKSRGTLSLARDLFGIKPLYVERRGEQVGFASEIKALGARSNRVLDASGLLDLFSLGFAVSCKSPLDGVEQVPPGEFWTFAVDAGGALHVTKRAAKTLRPVGTKAQATAAGLRSSLEASVSAHLISDVPVAVALSGGIDSSIVATLAADLGCRAVAYTNTFDAETDFEVKYARQLTAALGLSHRIVSTAVLDLEHLLREAMWFLEEPIPNPAFLNSFFVGKALRQEGYKVVLLGEGADELFAGYPWHRLAAEGKGCGDVAELFALYTAQRSSLKSARAYLSASWRRKLEGRVAEQREIFAQTLAEARGSRLEQFLHFDRRFQLTGSQLHRVDRMLMRHGIEGRVPFLCDDVLAAAAVTPDPAKLDLRRGWRALVGRRPPRGEKICLARAMHDRLPAEIARRKKWGKTGTTNLFNTPALEQLPAVFERFCRSADYAEHRAVLAEGIDFRSLSETRSKKTRLVICQLLLAIEYFVLGRPPQWNSGAYRIELADAHRRALRGAA